MNLDAHHIFERLTKAGSDYADKKAAFDALDMSSSSLKAKLMMKYEGSVASRETEALASQEWTDHIETLKAANAAALKARVVYDSAKVFVELQRDQGHTERMLLKQGGA